MRHSRRVESSSNAAKRKTHAEQLVAEITGEALKESVVQLTSDSDCRNCKVKKEKPTKEIVKESVRVSSDENKRMLDAALGKLGSVEVHPLLKKCESGQCLKPKLVVGPAVTPLTDGSRTPGSFCSNESISEKQERSGSSGKRRRSTWDSQSEGEGEGEGNEGDRGGKRRKIKWTDNGSLFKKLGPLKLPDFVKVPVSIADPQRQELNERLSVINSKLQRKDLHDDWPEEEWSPFPPPLDVNLEFGMNSKDVRLREELIQERQAIISRLIQNNPTFRSPTPEPKPSVFFKKLYLPVREYPGYNFFGLILGPRGNTQKRMEKETGAKITIKGKASGNDREKMAVRSGNEDLHVLVQADNQKSVDEAVSKVEKLLIPIDEGLNDHKHAQLEELSKICRVCGEEGHKSYVCPCRSSYFNSSCSRCGRSHVSFTCPFMAPSLSNSGGKNSSGSSPSYWSKSSIKSTPPTVESKIRTELDDRNLFVGHLPLTVDKNRLMELFSPFGTLVEAKVIKDRNAGFHKDYGIVRYDSAVNAAVAVAAMNGYLIDGKTLAVKLAGNVHVPGLSPRISVLSKYPATILKDSPSQTTCPCPPGPMLSSPRTPVYKCDALGLPPISIFPGHYDSSSGKKLPSSQGSSSYHFPNSSPSPVVWFRGSQGRISPSYRSNFFSTPTSIQSPQLYLTPPLGCRLTPLSC